LKLLNEVVIVSVARTPIGSFNGGLSSVKATTLGSIAIRGALSKIQLDPSHVEEVMMGCVLQANLGQAPARQAALGAGLPESVVCTTVNKVCASGMKALAMATQSIQTGNAECIVVGGMESMSQTPYYIDGCRKGMPFGNNVLVDGVNRDGLLNAYDQTPMGISAEATAKKYSVTREQQDEYAINTFKRAAAAWKEHLFDSEIVPVEVTDKKGNITLIAEDETYKVAQFDKIPKLKPSFLATNGTVTAASSSPLSDGAAAIIVMSAQKAKSLNITPLARILSTADAEQAPEWFTTSPSIAMPKAIHKAGLSLNDVDYFEINEAFAVVALANMQIMGFNADQKHRTNYYGGAVALGHPLGCSGARIVCTLLSVLRNQNGKIGCAGICNGGGGASAVVIEKL